MWLRWRAASWCIRRAFNPPRWWSAPRATIRQRWTWMRSTALTRNMWPKGCWNTPTPVGKWSRRMPGTGCSRAARTPTISRAARARQPEQDCPGTGGTAVASAAVPFSQNAARVGEPAHRFSRRRDGRARVGRHPRAGDDHAKQITSPGGCGRMRCAIRFTRSTCTPTRGTGWTCAPWRRGSCRACRAGRCCRPKLRGIIAAGRCVSSDRAANSALRVQAKLHGDGAGGGRAGGTGRAPGCSTRRRCLCGPCAHFYGGMERSCRQCDAPNRVNATEVQLWR